MYALNAVGWLPHMIFLVDFVARGMGQGVQVGSELWVVFGVAATLGPLATGRLADRLGFGPMLRLAFLLEAGAVAIPAFGLGWIWLIRWTVIMGSLLTGTVGLVLGRISELLPRSGSPLSRAAMICSPSTSMMAMGPRGFGLSAITTSRHGFGFRNGTPCVGFRVIRHVRQA
jgi:predicted MFS family arabinose efflux permease